MTAQPVADGPHLYVPRQPGQVEVFDISDAATIPAPVASVSAPAQILGLAIQRRLLYGALRSGNEIKIWGLANPAAPTTETAVSVSPTGSGPVLNGVAVSGEGPGTQIGLIETDLPLNSPTVVGDTLYVAQNVGLATVDLTGLWTTPGMATLPVYRGGTVNSDPVRADLPVRMLIDGPWAYLVGGTYRVFDLR